MGRTASIFRWRVPGQARPEFARQHPRAEELEQCQTQQEHPQDYLPEPVIFSWALRLKTDRTSVLFNDD